MTESPSSTSASSSALQRTLLTLATKSVVVNAAAMALAFLTQIALARLMGADGYGEYAYWLVWVNLLVFIGKFGWDTATLRFVPALRSAGQLGEVRAFRRRALGITLGASGALMVGMSATTVALDRFAESPSLGLNTALIASLLVPMFATTLIWGAFSQASQHVLVAQGVPNIVRPLLTIAGVGILALYRPVTATAAMTITVIAASLVCVLGWWFDRQTSREPSVANAASVVPVQDRHEWDRVATTMFGITTLTTLLNQMDLQMLGFYETGAALGIYAAASRLAMLVPFATAAANTGLAPLIARLQAEGRRDQIQAAVAMSSKWTTAMAFATFCFLAVAGSWCLGLFGAEFRDGWLVLTLLAAARLVQAVTGLGGHLLNMTGHHRAALTSVGTAVIAQALAAGLLTPTLGSVGVALAAGVGALVWGALTVAACIRHVDVNPLAFR